MHNFFDTLVQVLSADKKFFSEDGILLRNKVYEHAMRMDAGLLGLLLGNEDTKKRFFTDVASTLVFDKVGFGWVINNRQFLPDSYTRFKNRIGLTDGHGDLISTSEDVALVFPYKDCILEGGQTKEDQKRDEIFYNETLAPDEIDRLLYPKVLVNAAKFQFSGECDFTGRPVSDGNGEANSSHVSQFEENDNLIIRGNNLLALSSLLKRYEGQVKCIYIDPPYNTGDDDFKYNDNFNHSTWLTFMKNRLVEAKKLLKSSGAIFVQIDHHELGYVTVLMDEIFGIDNKVQIIAVKTASPAGFKTVNPGPIDVTEYILFYTKSKRNFVFKKSFVPVDYNSNYNLVVIRHEDIKQWKFMPIKKAALEDAGFASEKEAKDKYGNSWPVILRQLIARYAFEHSEDVVSVRDPHKPTDTLKALMKQSKECDHPLQYTREDGSTGYIYKGGALAFYSNKIHEIDGKRCVTELLSDFWNHISWAGIAGEGGVRLKNGKKPEKLIKQIFDMVTSPGDLILDYHLGSGTTCAVAHKMKLRYIGIEQLDYGENDCVKRLCNVIKGDSTGISQAVDWHGGGSFVYCELAKCNQYFVDEVMAAKTDNELKKILEQVLKTGFISVKVDPADIQEAASDFDALSTDDKKRFIMELLDKNMLYVNLCDLDDTEYAISDADKAFNRSFYQLEEKH